MLACLPHLLPIQNTPRQLKCHAFSCPWGPVLFPVSAALPSNCDVTLVFSVTAAPWKPATACQKKNIIGMLRVALFFVMRTVLLAIVVSAVVDALGERASSSAAPLCPVRLHRRADDASLSRYTPFDLSDAQQRSIAVFEYWAYLGIECVCRGAREVSSRPPMKPFFFFLRHTVFPSTNPPPPPPSSFFLLDNQSSSAKSFLFPPPSNSLPNSGRSRTSLLTLCAFTLNQFRPFSMRVSLVECADRGSQRCRGSRRNDT